MREELSPPEVNGDIISKYFSEFSLSRYQNNFGFFMKHGHPNELQELIKKYKLKAWSNEVLYFWIEFSDVLHIANWMAKENLVLELQKRATEINRLIELLERVRTQTKVGKVSSWEFDKLPAIKWIDFVPEKGTPLRIKTYGACYDVATILHEKLNTSTKRVIDKSQNTDRRTYLKDFVLHLKPFVAFLEGETNSFRSKNEIYKFLSAFVYTMEGRNEISEDKIKDTLKKSRK